MPEGPWIRRHRVLAVVAATALILLIVGVAFWRFFPGDPPEFPPGQEFEVRPPKLTVESARSWEFETHAVLFVAKAGRVEMRMSYRPDDGGPRVRLKSDGDDLPWPEDGTWEVAAVLAAEAEEPWLAFCSRVFGDSLGLAFRSIYLAGLKSDDSMGVVPLLEARPKEMWELQDRLSPLILRDILSDPVLEIEVRRVRDRVRYRWGHIPDGYGEVPAGGGEVALAADQVHRGDVGALAPLRQFFDGLGGRLLGSRYVVLLADESVRYVEVLRAVEQVGAGSDLRILPVPGPGQRAYQRKILVFDNIEAEPLPWECARDDRFGGPRAYFNVMAARVTGSTAEEWLSAAPARIFAGGASIALGEIGTKVDVRPMAEVVIRAEEEALWSMCKAVARKRALARRLELRRAMPKRMPLHEAIENAPKRLEFERKTFTDALKMSAYRAESALVNAVTPGYRRARHEARKLVQEALRASGDLQIDDHGITVRLEPLSSAHRTRVLKNLCETLTGMNAVYPGTKLPLRYELKRRRHHAAAVNPQRASRRQRSSCEAIPRTRPSSGGS